MVGKSKMSNWKSAISGWNSRKSSSVGQNIKLQHKNSFSNGKYKTRSEKQSDALKSWADEERIFKGEDIKEAEVINNNLLENKS